MIFRNLSTVKNWHPCQFFTLGVLLCKTPAKAWKQRHPWRRGKEEEFNHGGHGVTRSCYSQSHRFTSRLPAITILENKENLLFFPP